MILFKFEGKNFKISFLAANVCEFLLVSLWLYIYEFQHKLKSSQTIHSFILLVACLVILGLTRVWLFCCQILLELVLESQEQEAHNKCYWAATLANISNKTTITKTLSAAIIVIVACESHKSHNTSPKISYSLKK